MKQNVINMNIPLDQLQEKVCAACGTNLHVQAWTLKAVPALYSPSGKPDVLALPHGFVCVNCGAAMPLRPEPEQTEGAAATKIIMLG